MSTKGPPRRYGKKGSVSSSIFTPSVPSASRTVRSVNNASSDPFFHHVQEYKVSPRKSKGGPVSKSLSDRCQRLRETHEDDSTSLRRKDERQYISLHDLSCVSEDSHNTRLSLPQTQYVIEKVKYVFDVLDRARELNLEKGDLNDTGDISLDHMLISKSDLHQMQESLEKLYDNNQHLLTNYDQTILYIKKRNLFEDFRQEMPEICTYHIPSLEYLVPINSSSNSRDEEMELLKREYVQLLAQCNNKNVEVEDRFSEYKQDISDLLHDAQSKLEYVMKLLTHQTCKKGIQTFREEDIGSVVDEIFSTANYSNLRRSNSRNFVDAEKKLEIKRRIVKLSCSLGSREKDELLDIFRDIQNRTLILQLQRDNAESGLEQLKKSSQEEIDRLNSECHTLRESLIDLWDNKRR